MSTDFSHNNTTISTTGGFRPNVKNTPLDTRTVVNSKVDIASIPVPFVGMEITVLQDETKGNKMTVYKVTSLNERNAIDINTGIEDVTVPKNVSQLTNDSNFVTDTELETKSYATETYVNNKLDGHSFKFLTQAEYDLLTDGEKKDTSVVYYIIDKADGGLTEAQLQKLQKAYEHSQTAHAPVNAEENVQSDWSVTDTNSDAFIKNKPTVPTKTSQLTNDSGFLTDIPSEYVTETELNSKGYATENYVNNKLDGHSFRFLTKAEYDNLPENERNNPLIEYHITDAANEGLTENQLQQLDTAYKHSQSTHVQQSDIPTKVSELQNDSGYITDIPSEYVTDTELVAKSYATETYVTNSLNGRSFKFLTQAEYDLLTDVEKNDTSIVYYITDKADEGLTENQLQQLQTAFNHSQTAHAPANAEENVQSDWNVTDETSDSFIKNKPKIPTKTSELTNDSSLATESFVTSKIAEASISGGEVDLSAYQLKSDTSLTTTDKTIVGAINEVNSGLSTKVGTSEVNSAINSYVTEHKAELKGEKGDKGDKGDAGNEGLTTNIIVNGNTYNHVNGTITLPNYPTVPTKTSQLTNDSGFLTNIPSEYVTETELNSKGYLTSVPNEYVTETELNSKGFSKIWSGTQSAYDALTDKTLYDYYFIEE